MINFASKPQLHDSGEEWNSHDKPLTDPQPHSLAIIGIIIHYQPLATIINTPNMSGQYPSSLGLYPLQPV